MSNFGSGSNSNGNFWYGNSTNFPGFLYKKNLGVGGRKSTKMNPGGNTTCNGSTYLYNKYKPGSSGVGASSTSNRRAKNRLATVCNGQKCFPCYTTLGQYSNYTHNPNGFIPCPTISSYPTISQGAILVDGNVTANMNTTGMNRINFTNNDDGYAYLSFNGMEFYFAGNNYGNSDGTDQDTSIYISSNYAFGFGPPNTSYQNWPADGAAILFDFLDSWNLDSYVSPPQLGTNPGVKYVRLILTGTDYKSVENYGDYTVKKAYEVYYVRDNNFQYMQFNCNVANVDRTQYHDNIAQISNGLSFQNTFGGNFSSRTGPLSGQSYVIRSDLNGHDWKFFPNTHLNL